MKKALIDKLIKNETNQFTEEDRPALEALDEDVLAKIPNAEPAAEPPVPPTPEAPAANAAAPVTVEAYIASAPEPLRDVLTNMMATHNATKSVLVDTICANANNKFSREFLSGKSVAELQGMVALIGNTTTQTPPPMFSGAATPGGPVTNASHQEEHLIAPVMNFGTDKE